MYRYYGSHPTIVSAYAYGAAVHCLNCAYRAHGRQYGMPETDTYGEPLTPIFAGEETEYMHYCDDCGAALTD